MQRHRFDYLFVLAVPWVALVSCVHGLQIGPMRHTGLIWLLTWFVGLMLILLRGPKKIHFPWIWWAPLYVFLFCSLFWSQMNWKYNIQLFIQMTVYPITGIVASFAIETHAEMKRMLRDYTWVLFGILGAYLFYAYGPGQSLQASDEDLYVGFAARPAAMTLIVTGAIFLSQIAKAPLRSTALWGLSFLVALLTGSRMVTLVLMTEWISHPRLASIKARIGVILLTLAIGLAAFNTPIIQDRFFMKKSGFSGKGTISDVFKGKFDSAGRFDSWPKILEASQERPWIGHGIGESGPFVYRIWAPIDKPHNEYLKMLFDGGYMALGLYFLGLFGTLANLARLNRLPSSKDNWAIAAAYMAWVGFILMSIVDNPLVCGNNYLDPLFVLVGAANALAVIDKQAAHQRGQGHVQATDVACPAVYDTSRLPELIPLR